MPEIAGLSPLPGGFAASDIIPVLRPSGAAGPAAPYQCTIAAIRAALALVTAAATATGSSQGDAQPIVADATIVTVAVAGGGVVLPTGTNQTRRILNRAAGNIMVYPPPGGQIEAQGTDAPGELAPGHDATLRTSDGVQWWSSAS